MKKISILLLGLLIVLTVQGQKNTVTKTDKLKSITVWGAETKKGKTISYKESYEEYNSSGNVVRKMEYTKKGIIKHKETATYDASGNKTEETVYDIKDNDNYKRTFQYNAGVKASGLEYDSSGTVVKKITYTCDLNGNVTSEIYTDAAGNLLTTITRAFNKYGKEISVVETSKDGTIMFQQIVTYGANGKKAIETILDLKEKTDYKITYKYDAFKDKTEEDNFNNITGTLISKTAYTYNADGEKTSEIFTDATGAVTKKVVYTYNSSKLRETKQTFSSIGSVISTKKYFYEYF